VELDAAARQLALTALPQPGLLGLRPGVCERARLAEHDLVPGLDGEPRDGTADLSASDEFHSCHLSVPSEDSFAGFFVSGACRQLAGKE
jgi:hypothetical protein